MYENMYDLGISDFDCKDERIDFVRQKEHLNGVVRLFREIILQAFRDVDSVYLEVRQPAIDWLIMLSDDMRFVCEIADLNPENIRKSANFILSTPLKNRIKKGKGKVKNEYSQMVLEF